jgi:hypothetical protein
MARTQDSRTVNWAFFHHADVGQWTWRQLSVDGSIAEISSPLSDFGSAVGDALKHGFRPKEHHWVVSHRTGTTHFHPGNTPISIPSDRQAVKPPNGRKLAPASTKREENAN